MIKKTLQTKKKNLQTQSTEKVEINLLGFLYFSVTITKFKYTYVCIKEQKLYTEIVTCEE